MICILCSTSLFVTTQSFFSFTLKLTFAWYCKNIDVAYLWTYRTNGKHTSTLTLMTVKGHHISLLYRYMLTCTHTPCEPTAAAANIHEPTEVSVKTNTRAYCYRWKDTHTSLLRQLQRGIRQPTAIKVDLQIWAYSKDFLGAGMACRQSAGLVTKRLGIWIKTGEVGEFSPPALTLCADFYSVSVPPLCYRSGM